MQQHQIIIIQNKHIHIYLYPWLIQHWKDAKLEIDQEKERAKISKTTIKLLFICNLAIYMDVSSKYVHIYLYPCLLEFLTLYLPPPNNWKVIRLIEEEKGCDNYMEREEWHRKIGNFIFHFPFLFFSFFCIDGVKDKNGKWRERRHQLSSSREKGEAIMQRARGMK